MECPQCTTANPQGAKFCMTCGFKLAVICSQCDATLPPEAKFCLECGAETGAPLSLAPPDPLRKQTTEMEAQVLPSEERKQATILFCDLVGFTPMAEKMDPEEVREVLNLYFKPWREAIARHGGVLEKFIGDAVMAVFGIPTARENDPENAIRAALEVRDEFDEVNDVIEGQYGIRLAMRVGISTGLVLVGAMGREGDYTVTGDTVNLTSRLEGKAPAGGILISHDTYRHVRGVFDVRVQEPLTVKGKSEPVQTYIVLKEKPRAFHKGTRGVKDIETRMIGRETELARLQEAFYTATEDSECQMVTVTGEAGVGKSRLLFEFDAWAELQPEEFFYFKGRASQEMRNLPYALLRNLFAFRFQIQDNDPLEAVWEKVGSGFEDAFGAVADDPTQVQTRAHILGQLLGFDFSASPHVQAVGDDRQQLRDRGLVYLVDYFKALSSRDLILVLLEDIHWADDSSLDALNRLALALPECRVCIVCAARTQLFERRPHWGQGQAYHTRLDLHPLSKRDSRRLVAEILKMADEVPAALRDLVVGGAEGNPFYMEELIKMLIEDGVILTGEDRWQVKAERLTGVRVPPTLTSLLQARLDRLPQEERATLQRAAVVGRIFWDLVVARLCADAQDATAYAKAISANLSALQGREMVFRRETTAFAGTREYIFKHAILRDVTYESVPKRLRRVYHALVAAWLIEQGGERSNEFLGLIADHLERAGKANEAIAYFRRAGERATAGYANAEAVDYYSRALALVSEEDGETRWELLLGREAVYHLQGEREAQASDLDVLDVLAEARQRPGNQAEVALRRANYANAVSDYLQAVEHARAAGAYAQTAGDVGREADGQLVWGDALLQQGEYAAAGERLGRALALANAAGRRDLEASSLRDLGYVAYNQGNYTAARGYCEKSLAVAREIGDRRGEGAALNSLGLCASDQGDYAGARGYYEKSLAIFREIGYRSGEGITLNSLGMVASGQGDYAGARGYYEKSLAICREIGSRVAESVTLYNLGDVAYNQGNCAAARGYCEKSLAICRKIGDRGGEGYALNRLGDALVELGNPAEALVFLQQAIAIRRDLGQTALLMESQATLGRAYLAQGDTAQALAQVEEILAYLDEGGSFDGTEQPLRNRLTCYQVLQAAGDARAAGVLQAAFEVLQERAAHIPDEPTRRSFLENVPWHREIVEIYKDEQSV